VPGPPHPPRQPPEAAATRFPAGAAATVAELESDPHPVLARLREREPVSWLPALGGWLVTRYDIALRVLRDSGLFTVDDPRFTTARVVGPSMLSLDGAAHGHHREPFSASFRVAAVQARLASFVQAEAGRLVAALRSEGRGGPAELRRGLAGPLAVAVVAEVLGLGEAAPAEVLGWYDAIVAAVSALSAQQDQDSGRAPEAGTRESAAGARAFGLLADRLRRAMARPGGSSLLAAVAGQAGQGGQGALTDSEVVSNAAVLMFGGIETTEGMICNAVWHLLSHPGQLSLLLADRGLLPGAIEESLRLEPAAAVVDRYATADVRIGAAGIRRGDLVTVSLAGANRDPAVFGDPDRFDLRRDSARRNLAFARGPHFCLGAHLARLETGAAIGALLDRLPGLRLDPDQVSPPPRGLVFRKPPALYVRWPASDSR
jgi:cytochrome P450